MTFDAHIGELPTAKRSKGRIGRGPKKALTAAEELVMGMLVQGMTYKQMAAACHYSYSTVRYRLAHIYQFLHVYDRYEAAAKWAEGKQ